MTDTVTDLLIASLRAKRERARREKKKQLEAATSVVAEIARAQTLQARRSGYRDASTRYDGKGTES